MERFAPLFVLFLIYLFFGMAGSSKNKKNKQKQTPTQGPRKPAGKPEPVRQPSAEKKQTAVRQPEPQPVQSPHRGADGTLHPTERHQHATAAPSLLNMEGTGVEGFDPCHEYMLDDPVLPVCEDLAADEPAGMPAIPLSFTRDSVVNAVVMSEILNRKSRRPGVR